MVCVLANDIPDPRKLECNSPSSKAGDETPDSLMRWHMNYLQKYVELRERKVNLDAESIATYQTLARCSKDVLHALSQLSKFLKDDLNVLHQRMYAKYLHVGLSNLPDEILAQIVEWSDCNPMHLRAVSRRFHRLVMSTPHLWAKQTIDISHDENAFVDLALTYSRTQPLRIRIDDVHHGISSECTLHRLVAHSGRVQELEYLLNTDWVHGINRRFAGVELAFPRLRRLSLATGALVPLLRDLLDADDIRLSDITFTESWSAPQLNDLYVEGTALERIADSDLQRCTFAFKETSNGAHVGRLCALLAHNVSLRELTLTFSHFYVMNFDVTFPLAELNHLSAFTLLVRECDLCPGTIRMLDNILTNIIMPAVEVLHVELNVGSDAEESGVDGFVDAIIAKFNGNANVKRLNFSLDRAFVGAYRLPLDEYFLQPFPYLEHLTVETQCLPIDLDLSHLGKFPPLRTLTFRRCYGTDGSRLERIIRDIAYCVGGRLSGDGIVDDDGVVLMGKTVEPLKIILEACGHIDRSKLEAFRWPENVSFVWRDSVTENATA